MRAQFFLWSPVSRGVHAESFFLGVHAESGRFVSARADFFCAVQSTAGVRMQEFFLFVLSGHLFSAGRAQFFGRSCSARAPCMRVRGANFSFLSSRFQQLRAHFFYSPTLLPCDQSLCHPRSKETFFCHFRAAVWGIQGAQNFSFAQFFFFSCPVSSAQTLSFVFFHEISAVHFFRILRQKFEFFWHLPSAVSGSLATLVGTGWTGSWGRLNWFWGPAQLPIYTWLSSSLLPLHSLSP
jgi:hypothetical protein